jgi:hypothetical protein
MERVWFSQREPSGFSRNRARMASRDNIGDYMSKHRYDTNINELKTYFNAVIDWVS